MIHLQHPRAPADRGQCESCRMIPSRITRASSLRVRRGAREQRACRLHSIRPPRAASRKPEDRRPAQPRRGVRVLLHPGPQHHPPGGARRLHVLRLPSDLLLAWATDLMIGNFFVITCLAPLRAQHGGLLRDHSGPPPQDRRPDPRDYPGPLDVYGRQQTCVHP